MAESDRGELLTKFEEIFGTLVEHEVIKMVLQSCDWDSNAASEMILSMIDQDQLPPHVRNAVAADAAVRGAGTTPASATSTIVQGPSPHLHSPSPLGQSPIPLGQGPIPLGQGPSPFVRGPSPLVRGHSPPSSDRPSTEDLNDNQNFEESSLCTETQNSRSVSVSRNDSPVGLCSRRNRSVSGPSGGRPSSHSSALTPFAMAQGAIVIEPYFCNGLPQTSPWPVAQNPPVSAGGHQKEIVDALPYDDLSDKESDSPSPQSLGKFVTSDLDFETNRAQDTSHWVLAPEFVPNALQPRFPSRPLPLGATYGFRDQATLPSSNDERKYKGKASKKDEIIAKIMSGKNMLVLMRGLPGSGKSSLAKEVKGRSGVILSTDDYFHDKHGRYYFEPQKISEAHSWNMNRARIKVREGRTPVIIDNTNVQIWEMKSYVKLALQHGYEVDILEPETSWKLNPKELAKRNIHGVSKSKIKEMKGRYDTEIKIEHVIDTIRDFRLPSEERVSTDDDMRSNLSPIFKTEWPTTLPEPVRVGKPSVESGQEGAAAAACFEAKNKSGFVASDNSVPLVKDLPHKFKVGVTVSDEVPVTDSANLASLENGMSYLEIYGSEEDTDEEDDDPDVIIEGYEDSEESDNSAKGTKGLESLEKEECLLLKQDKIHHSEGESLGSVKPSEGFSDEVSKELVNGENIAEDDKPNSNSVPLEETKENLADTELKDVDNKAVEENTEMQVEEKIRALIEEANMDVDQCDADWDDLAIGVSEEEFDDEKFNELVNDFGSSLKHELEKKANEIVNHNDTSTVNVRAKDFDEDSAMYELCSNMEDKIGRSLSSVITGPNVAEEPSSLFSIINASDLESDSDQKTNIGDDLAEAIELPTTISNELSEGIELPTTKSNELSEAIELPTTKSNELSEDIELPMTKSNELSEAIELPTTKSNELSKDIELPTTKSNALSEAVKLQTTESNQLPGDESDMKSVITGDIVNVTEINNDKPNLTIVPHESTQATDKVDMPLIHNESEHNDKLVEECSVGSECDKLIGENTLQSKEAEILEEESIHSMIRTNNENEKGDGVVSINEDGVDKANQEESYSNDTKEASGTEPCVTTSKFDEPSQPETSNPCPNSLTLASWECVNVKDESLLSWDTCNKDSTAEVDTKTSKPTRQSRRRPSGDPQKWLLSENEESRADDPNSCDWEPVKEGVELSWDMPQKDKTETKDKHLISIDIKPQPHTGAVPKMRKNGANNGSVAASKGSSNNESDKVSRQSSSVSPVLPKPATISMANSTSSIKEKVDGHTQTLSIDFQALDLDNNLYELKILYGQPDYVPECNSDALLPENGPLTKGRLALDKGTMTEDSSDVSMVKPLQNLIAFFPNIAEAELRDVFEKCKYDLDWTMNVLLDGGYEMADTVGASNSQDDSEVGVEDVESNHETNSTGDDNERYSVADCNDISSDISEEKTRRLRQSHKPDDMVCKREIENSFTFSESVDDRVTRLTGKDFDNLNMNKVKQKKTKKKRSKKQQPEVTNNATQESVNGEEGEGAQLVTLVMNPLFASQLVSMFGPIGSCEMSGEMSPEDRSVILPLELCHQIHLYWTKTLDGKFNHEDQVLDSMIREDENYARRLQEEEDIASSNMSYNSSSLVDSGKAFELDPPTNLKEIMDLEQALQESQGSKNMGNEASLSSHLSLQRLYTEYPHVDRDALKQEFTESGLNYQDTVKRIYNRYGCGQGAPKTVIAPEMLHQYEQQMIQKAKELSLAQQELEIPSQQEDDDDDEIQPDDPQVYRDEAQTHYHQRQEFYRKAQEAHRNGMKAVAAYYASIGKLHSEKLNEANHRASMKILEAVNSTKDANVLDLHLLHVPEALSATQAFLSEREQVLTARGIRQMKVSLITGRGAHSIGGQAKLKPAIKDFLKKLGYSYHEANSGMFIVTLKR